MTEKESHNPKLIEKEVRDSNMLIFKEIAYMLPSRKTVAATLPNLPRIAWC
jgi:hypothetical protein